ncbi:MAG: hypothetical protein OIN88_16400 [Candidatus Methanoperedens sp.]|nr:hypothetical protein [Candidatus Methanoperedens sp.]
MVREAYHRDLHKLKADGLKMGVLVGRAIGDAVLSLKNRDIDLAQKVIQSRNRGRLHASACAPAANGKGFKAYHLGIKDGNRS